MKPIYRIFSKIKFNNIISSLFIIGFLFWSILISTRINNFESLISIGSGIIIGLAFCIYAINITFLPIIRIDDNGISAFSIFWKREMSWNEIKKSKLILLNVGYGIWEEFSELKNVDEIDKLDIGKKIYIFLSKKDIEIPISINNSSIFSHNRIANKNTIVFAFEKKAWSIVRQKLSL